MCEKRAESQESGRSSANEGRERKKTNLLAVDRVDLNPRGEVSLEVEGVDVDLIDGSRRATGKARQSV